MNSKEEKLLIELMKGTAKEESYKSIDWKQFILLCYYNKVTYFIQEKLDKKFVPKEAIEKLRNINRETISFNMLLNNEMLSLSRELEKQKIEFLALKGMALNNSIYSENFCRFASDIDLLIKEENYFQIKEILEKKSYSSALFGFWNGKLVHQHYPYLTKKIQQKKIVFELHKDLFFTHNCFSINQKKIWNDSQKIDSLRIPCNEDLLIFAVISFVYQHYFTGVFQALIDAKNLSEKIDETKLKQKVIEYNVTEIIVWFNELMKEVFGTEIKGIKELEQKADKKKLDYLRKKNLQWLVAKRNLTEIKLIKLRNFFFWTKGLKQKLKVLFFALIVPNWWKIKKQI